MIVETWNFLLGRPFGLFSEVFIRQILSGASSWTYTLPKFNIAREKLPSQEESSLPTTIFQGLC